MSNLRFPKTPKTIKVIIYVNVIVYIASFISERFGLDLSLIFGATPVLIIEKYFLWQLFTYMFVHANIFHLLLNLLMLWMLGTELYYLWGRNFFIKYYFICGLGGGISILLMSFVDQRTALIPTVGSSGAIFGLLLAYGITFKNKLLYVLGLFPVKAGILVIILGAVEFFSLFSNKDSSISHIAHLGGLITGLAYLKIKELEKKLTAKKYSKLKERYKVVVDNRDIDNDNPKLWN